MEDARRLGNVKICMIGSSGGDVSFPITTDKGGTGNTAGYIRTGQKANTEMGENATAEGSNTESSGDHSHAEGDRTVASGYAAHAEGSQSTASGDYSHAESKSTASGEYSHAEGSSCVASGKYSHAGGNSATASGWGAFAHGEAVTAGYSHQTVVGHGNDNKSGTLFEVGNGTGLTLSDVSNAFEVYSDGKISCDNGSSKFKFTQNNGADGYYDEGGIWHPFGTGGGSSVKKTRYTITASSWSASANADGYYTYTLALSPALKSSPTVYLAGDTASAGATDTEKSMYALLDRCRLSGSSVLVLYAKTKPTSNFYIYVEGEEGTTADSIEGTIVPIKEENVYSLGEREIGTWFGAPYYRKCFEYSQAIAPSDTIYIDDSIFSDPSKIRRLEAVAITAANASGKITACILPYVARSGDATKNCNIQINQDGSNLMIFNGSAGQTYTHVYITVEYVK